jgi:hypothetical protein
MRAQKPRKGGIVAQAGQQVLQAAATVLVGVVSPELIDRPLQGAAHRAGPRDEPPEAVDLARDVGGAILRTLARDLGRAILRTSATAGH